MLLPHATRCNPNQREFARLQHMSYRTKASTRAQLPVCEGRPPATLTLCGPRSSGARFRRQRCCRKENEVLSSSYAALRFDLGLNVARAATAAPVLRLVKAAAARPPHTAQSCASPRPATEQHAGRSRRCAIGVPAATDASAALPNLNASPSPLLPLLLPLPPAQHTNCDSGPEKSSAALAQTAHK